MSAIEPLVWCLCEGAVKPVMSTSDQCKGPPCNGTIIGPIVLAVSVKKKKKKKKK
jgi:hypothetical protein